MPESKYPQRRQALLDFISAYAREHGCSPNTAAIARRLGISHSVCRRYLRKLRQERSLPPAAAPIRSGYLHHRAQLLRQIGAFIEQRGYAPSLRELAVLLELSPATLLRYIRLLQAEGLLSYTPGTARSLRVV